MAPATFDQTSFTSREPSITHIVRQGTGCGPPCYSSTVRSLVLLASCVAVMGCDGLRPSTFTSGWNDPSPDPTNPAASVSRSESESDDELEPEPELVPQPAPLVQRVFDDWRRHHDGSSPCPPEMVLIKDFCIDRWEASLVEVTESGDKAFAPTQRPERRLVRAVSRRGAIPQGYISGAEAQRACEMAGKRLCLDSEWFAACSGPKRTIYPYGTVHKEGACNEERKLHPMLELYGADAGPEIWMVEPMNNPEINSQPGTVTPTGMMPECVGSYGVFDMVGNLHEWANDPAGTFHGGAYSTNNKLGCQYATTAHGLGYHDYSTGFRCCSEPREN